MDTNLLMMDPFERLVLRGDTKDMAKSWKTWIKLWWRSKVDIASVSKIDLFLEVPVPEKKNPAIYAAIQL